MSVTDGNAANQAANDFGPESVQGSQVSGVGAPLQELNEQKTVVGTEEPAVAVEETSPVINGTTAGESWADDQPNPPEPADEFQSVERRHGGGGRGGGYRGRGPRGGEYRGRGGYRERGERGDRSGRGGRGGGYRGYHRGGDGERGYHHPRGDGDRGGHYFRPRGGDRQQQPQQPAAAP